MLWRFLSSPHNQDGACSSSRRPPCRPLGDITLAVPWQLLVCSSEYCHASSVISGNTVGKLPRLAFQDPCSMRAGPVSFVSRLLPGPAGVPCKEEGVCVHLMCVSWIGVPHKLAGFRPSLCVSSTIHFYCRRKRPCPAWTSLTVVLTEKVLWLTH